MGRSHELLNFFVYFILISTICSVNGHILAGVTKKSHSFLKTDGNRFHGLCVDLMEAIKEKTGINYSLYLVDDNKYGSTIGKDGRLSGLVGDVYDGKADFAIADMTVLPIREKYVTFTKPFFSFSISALVHKSNVKNLKTIDDLALKSNLSIGVINPSNTFGAMSQKKSVRSIRWLHERILKNESNLLRSNEEALRKVRTEKFAFLQEEPRNAFLASEDCNLTVLHDPQYYFFGQYAIAFKHNSSYLIPFNIAIERLEKEGFLTRLKAKYFLQDNCTNSSAINHYFDNFYMIFLFVLVIRHFI